jgi:hypothetical protein
VLDRVLGRRARLQATPHPGKAHPHPEVRILGRTVLQW